MKRHHAIKFWIRVFVWSLFSKILSFCACCLILVYIFVITKLRFAFLVAISSVDTIFMLYSEFPLSMVTCHGGFGHVVVLGMVIKEQFNQICRWAWKNNVWEQSGKGITNRRWFQNSNIIFYFSPWTSHIIPIWSFNIFQFDFGIKKYFYYCLVYS